MFVECLKFIIKNLFTKKKQTEKNIWLIAEDGQSASSNGFHLYGYLLNHQESGIVPVYLISQDSPDRKNVKDLGGEIVEPGSKRHFELLYQAGALISTVPYGFAPDSDVYYTLAEWGFFHPKGVNVFLQEKIVDRDIEELHRDSYRPDLFVTSSEEESEIVRKVLDQPCACVKNIGMCRYDRFWASHACRKRVLVVSKWDEALSGLSKTEFLETDYVKKWRVFLFDRHFVFEVCKAGYELTFFVAHDLKDYAFLFEHEGVEVVTGNLHSLLSDSEILVTDDFQLCFDMAYMHRNTVLFQFDRKDDSRALINHEMFGYPVNSRTDAEQIIIDCVTSKRTELYDSEYVEKFFSHHDWKQCERTINAIKEKQN